MITRIMPAKNQPGARGSTHLNTTRHMTAVNVNFNISPMTAACRKALLLAPSFLPANTAKKTAGKKAAILPNNDEYAAVRPRGLNAAARTRADNHCGFNHFAIGKAPRWVEALPDPAATGSGNFSGAGSATINAASLTCFRSESWTSLPLFLLSAPVNSLSAAKDRPF